MRYRFSLLPFAVRFLLGNLLLLLSLFIQLAHAADAELRIETHLSDTSPAPGETFTYSIRYRCAGISSLYCTAPRITTTIPEPLKIVGYTPTGGSVAQASLNGKTLAWQLATPPESLPQGVPTDGLTAGSTGILKVQVKFPSCGSSTPPARVSLQASATTGEFSITSIAPDINVPATMADACPSPPPPASPGFNKTGSATFVQPGGLERWSISLPSSATAYTITENVPPGMQVYTAAASNATAVGHPSVDCSDNGEDDFTALTQTVAAWMDAEVAAGRADNLHSPSGTPTGCTARRLASGLLVGNIKRLRWSVKANLAAQSINLAMVVDSPYIGGDIRNCATSSQHGISCAPSIPVLGQGEPLLSISKINPTGGVVSPDGSTIVYAPPLWQPTIAPAPAGNDRVYRVAIGLDELSGTSTQYPIIEDVLPTGLDYHLEQGGNWWRVALPNNRITTTQPACKTPQFSHTRQADGRVALRWAFPGCHFPVGQADLGLAVYFSVRINPGTAVGTRLTNVASFATGDFPLVGCVNGADAGDTGRSTCRSSNVSYTVPELTTLDSVKWVKGALDSAYHRTPNVGNTTAHGMNTYLLEIRNTGNVTNTQIDIVDVLPALGDSALVTGVQRLSEWNAHIAGEPSLQRITASGNVTTIPANEWSLDATSSDTRIGLRWQPLNGLAPGEKLQISLPAQTLDATAANRRVAWNSFAYTASYFDTSSKTTETLLTSEPPKVGLMMVDTDTTAGLGGIVWFDSNNNKQHDATELPFTGVSVRIYDGDERVAETLTDANGNYTFWGLKTHSSYRLVLDKPDDYLAGNPLGGFPEHRALDATTGAAGSFTPDYAIGLSQPASIGNKVWFDRNADGAQDPDEPGIANVTVNLHNAQHTLVASTQTNTDGHYGFENIPVGDYYLTFAGWPAGYVASPMHASGDKNTDSDLAANGRTAILTLTAGTRDYTWDFGLTLPRQIDLQLSKKANKNSIKYGESITYTLSLYNAGADEASGVQVQDRLPPALRLQTATPAGDYDPATGLWNVGWLGAGQRAELQITAQVVAP
jgi:uncharacterized repeat protein (TIGR01451 family)